ncbi:hypothetical protein SKAU_G00163240 [Synaphobranchus kaupii]|uniref:Uncharacterized protein n=1 Tax=Synaphobranchus kaupii TaxID=118154 RepID=A0A9Q1FJD2_SYNKA|nr:hypothetical protein SKAU_G00163240 [Synaphobranchus kaupii]
MQNDGSQLNPSQSGTPSPGEVSRTAGEPLPSHPRSCLDFVPRTPISSWFSASVARRHPSLSACPPPPPQLEGAVTLVAGFSAAPPAGRGDASGLAGARVVPGETLCLSDSVKPEESGTLQMNGF